MGGEYGTYDEDKPSGSSSGDTSMDELLGWDVLLEDADGNGRDSVWSGGRLVKRSCRCGQVKDRGRRFGGAGTYPS